MGFLGANKDVLEKSKGKITHGRGQRCYVRTIRYPDKKTKGIYISPVLKSCYGRFKDIKQVRPDSGQTYNSCFPSVFLCVSTSANTNFQK